MTSVTKADIDASARLLVAFLERNQAERLIKFLFSYSYGLKIEETPEEIRISN